MLQGFVHVEAKELCFGINSHSPKTDRILPQVFQDKVTLALWDDKQDPQALADFKICLQRFKTICRSYGVELGSGQTIVGLSLAECPYLDDLKQILDQVLGWPIQVLDKEQEFKAYIYGLAGTFHPVRGLYLRVTAQHVYMSWIFYSDNQELRWGKVNELPYGGVALARRLSKESMPDIEAEIARTIAALYDQLDLPEELVACAREEGGLRVYMHSRGLPYVAKFFHGDSVSPLIIGSFNSAGYSCARKDVLDVSEPQIKQHCTTLGSSRKAAFFEATVVLLRGLCTGVPSVRKILYDRNGVREGILFQQMPPEIFAEDPLLVSTRAYALPGAAALAKVLATALPEGVPKVIQDRIVPALTNSAYVHSSYPRNMQALLGLTIGLGGVLTGVQGLSHEVRVLLGIALYKRWGGEPSETSVAIVHSFSNLFQDPQRFWWAFYVGSVMHVLGGMFPGAHVHDNVVSFKIEGPATDFTLFVRANQKSVLANNKIVFERLRGLPGVLNDIKRLLRLPSCPVRVQVDWYKDDGED